MPELAFAELDLPATALYLAAVMAFPRNPERHQEFLDLSLNSAVRSYIRKLPPEKACVPAWLAQMAADRTMDDLVREERLTSFGPGEGVGLTLIYVLASAAQQPPGEKNLGTLKNAREVVGKFLKTRRLGAKSRSQLTQHWSDFRSAAHLLATRLFFHDLWCEIGGDLGCLAVFLSLAETLRRRGESYYLPGTTSTLLDPRESWRAPSWMGLPNVTVPLPDIATLNAELSRRTT